MLSKNQLIHIIVYLGLILLLCIIYIVCSMYQQKKEDERESKGTRRDNVKHSGSKRFVFACMMLFMVMLTGPITNITNQALDCLVQRVEKLLQKKTVSESVISDNTETEGDSSEDVPLFSYTDKNRIVKDYTSLPASERILTPEDTRYPNVNMEAVSTEGSSAQVSGYQGAKRSTVAVTFPFEGISSEELFVELEHEILRNPLVGDMIARGLTEEGSGVAKEEVWLQDFVNLCDQAYELPYDDENSGMGFWLAAYKFSDGERGIYVSDEYRKYAEKICVFLEGFVNYGVHTFKAKACYSRNLAVDFGNRRTEISKDGEVELPGLVLYKPDDEGQVNCVIGFDLNDKGMLIYDASVLWE